MFKSSEVQSLRDYPLKIYPREQTKSWLESRVKKMKNKNTLEPETLEPET